LNDVIGGYVSIESAERDYGVVIRKTDDAYGVDEKATRGLREERRAKPQGA